mmetsp:Transcript_12642/g.18913  ORF Transcript_12642/g.18913 Transcript_12642/m.18913 type:complete len:82 (+) Transcript_12642:161-406(+)
MSRHCNRMVAAKAIHDTNDMDRVVDDNGTLKAYVSHWLALRLVLVSLPNLRPLLLLVSNVIDVFLLPLPPSQPHNLHVTLV